MQASVCVFPIMYLQGRVRFPTGGKGFPEPTSRMADLV